MEKPIKGVTASLIKWYIHSVSKAGRTMCGDSSLAVCSNRSEV